MATSQEIKKALDSLSGGLINKDQLIDTVLEQTLKTTYGDSIDSSTLKEMVKQSKESDSMLYRQTYAKVSQLDAQIQGIKDTAQSLIQQITMVSTTVAANPYTAGAAPSMLLTIKSIGSQLKQSMSQSLSTAYELGIDIPGIDPIIDTINIIGGII